MAEISSWQAQVLMEHTVLMNKHGINSDEVKDFEKPYAGETELLSLFETSKSLNRQLAPVQK